MSKTTRATQTLTQLGVAFTLHSYDYDPDADSIGLQAAEALGAEPHRVLKTLMAEVDGKPVCVIVPSDCEVSMKKLASCVRRQGRQNDAPGRCRTAHRLSRRRHQPVRAEEARCRPRSNRRQ